MRAHYLQHVPFEGLGSIERWLASKGYEVTHTKFFESIELPDASAIDLLVILGGPMSVNDVDKFTWLATEKQFVREIIHSGKSVLGICLGAQLIANAMGAKVFPNTVKEIGWFPIHATQSPDAAVFNFPQETQVFHWHGETFDLPAGAIRLAKSAGCVNQAFQIGKSVIGLQFHLETTPDSAKQMLVHCGDELVPSRYVQTADEILSANQNCYKSINILMDNILEFLNEAMEKAE